MNGQRTKAIVLYYVLGSGRYIKTYVFIIHVIIKLLVIVLMQTDAESIFPNTF